MNSYALQPLSPLGDFPQGKQPWHEVGLHPYSVSHLLGYIHQGLIRVVFSLVTPLALDDETLNKKHIATEGDAQQ